MNRRLLSACVAGVLLSGHPVLGAEPDTGSDIRKENLAKADKIYKERVKDFGESDRYLVRPGLLADREKDFVAVHAEATGVTSEEIIEFVLISPESGHGYEAIAYALAEPSDVHAALEFVGCSPGDPIDPDKFMFWPKGQRVDVSIQKEGKGGEIPVENFILDQTTGTNMVSAGFIFVGSRRSYPVADSGVTRYGADIWEPRSIVSTYNEPTTVLDVPRQAGQSATYGRYYPWSPRQLKAGEFLTMILRPVPEALVTELDLRMTAGTNAPVFRLSQSDGTVIREAGDMDDVVKTFDSLQGRPGQLFVTLDFGRNLRLRTVRDICRLFSMMDTENGIHVGPPPSGQPYYRAFVANEEIRDRGARVVHPWELRLRLTNDLVKATLIDVREEWPEQGGEPVCHLKELPVAGPAEMVETLLDQQKDVPALIIFADPGIRYGQLLEYTAPVMDTHPLIHVFLDVEPIKESETSAATPD